MNFTSLFTCPKTFIKRKNILYCFIPQAAKNSILGERKFRLMNQRDMEKLNEDYHTEKYLRHQQVHETLIFSPSLRNLARRRWFERSLLLSWEVAMSTYLVQVEAQLVAKQAGTVARKTRRTRTSDSVVGFMQQRPSRLRDMCRKRGKDMAFDVLPPS